MPQAMPTSRILQRQSRSLSIKGPLKRQWIDRGFISKCMGKCSYALTHILFHYLRWRWFSFRSDPCTHARHWVVTGVSIPEFCEESYTKASLLLLAYPQLASMLIKNSRHSSSEHAICRRDLPTLRTRERGNISWEGAAWRDILQLIGDKCNSLRARSASKTHARTNAKAVMVPRRARMWGTVMSRR